jgi:hypothetical protein
MRGLSVESDGLSRPFVITPTPGVGGGELSVPTAARFPADRSSPSAESST